MPKAFFHLLKYCFGIDPASTQTTVAERDCISRHAQGKKRCVEIGVFEGVTTGVIASNLSSEAVLFAVDPFLKGRSGICWGMPIAHREVKRHTPKCTIQFVRAFSHDACRKIPGDFDFIFIDGDHSLDGITQDWSDWSMRVEGGGIIGLHDTLIPPHNPSVANLGSHRYFMSHIKNDTRFEIVDQVDSLSILRRR
jgi:predicted O-methyltransferase YrrM